MRINQFLAVCGIASRRKAEDLILEGKVSVNGVVTNDLSFRITRDDVVAIEGKPIAPIRTRTIIAFHKPPGVICSRTDPKGRKIGADYLPEEFKKLKYIGRLDFQTRGLILLSNDGELVYRLTHPKFQIERRYFVWTNKKLSRHAMECMLAGVDIGDGRMGRVQDIYLHDGFTELVLTEGRNREIRNMLLSLDYEVEDLKRVSYANINLSGIAVGDYRELTEQEKKDLKEIVGM